jgi:hypothetical protein
MDLFRSIGFVRRWQPDPAIRIRHVPGQVFAIERLNAGLTLAPLAQLEQDIGPHGVQLPQIDDHLGEP